MGLHKNLTSTDIHIIYAFSYADAATRAAASGFVSGDVGKVARQTDNESYWLLTAVTPTWTQINPSGLPPSGAAGGDLTSTYPNPVVANLAITDAKVAAANKDGTAGTASMRTIGTGALQACAGNDSRLSDSRAPTGSAGGDLGSTYPNPTVPSATGLRSATTSVNVAAATAPATGQVLTATDSTHATWQTPSSSTFKQSLFSELTADTTTTSTTFVDLLTVSITTTASTALLIFSDFSCDNTNNSVVNFRITVDGTAKRGAGCNITAAKPSGGAISQRITGLSAGSHTIKLQWYTSSNTARINVVTTPDTHHASLMVEEVSV